MGYGMGFHDNEFLDSQSSSLVWWTQERGVCLEFCSILRLTPFLKSHPYRGSLSNFPFSQKRNIMNKQFLNDPKNCVDDFIEGLLYAHPGLVKLPGHKVVLRKDLGSISGKVALLCGGGAGHEPFAAGFVGKGMLTGAISGAVFTSPGPSSIFAAIKAVHKYNPNGVLLILMNYTGDRLNFGLAKEWALSENIQVEMVVVNEDCALKSADRSAGRRGLSGSVFALKIAGAMAESGATIGEIADTLRRVVTNMGTIGVCLKPCMLPGSRMASFSLDDSEMEIGLGIHGEAGVKRMEMQSSSATVEAMFQHMLDERSSTHLPIKEKEDVAVLVNNLGGTSQLEMGIIVKDVRNSLRKRNFNLRRLYSGMYMTSLQMSGFLLTVLKLSDFEGTEANILSYLDAPTNVAAPLISVRYDNLMEPKLEEFSTISSFPKIIGGLQLNNASHSLMRDCISAACKELITNEDTLNDYDRGAGDGDCGTTHCRGARKVFQIVQSEEDFSYPVVALQKIAEVCGVDMGGSSGAIYSILFTTMAHELRRRKEFNIRIVAEALKEGTDAVKRYGGAMRGDRTIVDVLEPYYESILRSKESDSKNILREGVKIAEDAAQNTLCLEAKAGRASYVSKDELKYPDPGAKAVTIVIKAITDSLIK